MRISSFEVRSKRSIHWAKCEQVPPLMVIAGPNGAGKSTLMNELRGATTGRSNNILYVGPHRALRRQIVQQRHLLATNISIETILASLDIPGFEGIQVTTGTRDAWGYDDAANYLKHALCQIEIERQDVIAKRYDQDGQIAPGAIVDPWKPLKELTYYLLPHLKFIKIDTSNRQQVRCLWQVHDQAELVDLDDLSSGEKSIIQMFYPIIEHRIKDLLHVSGSHEELLVRSEVCVLIDEPELHLHPNLQYKVLDYLRQLTADGQMQVIVTTHSPTIVESATFEELFLLRPVELTGKGQNQLIQVASDEERLDLLRNTFGTTSNITAMQPLLIIEGVSESKARNVTSDRKIYRFLHPGFDSVSIICGGGKGECKKLLEPLNRALQAFSPKLQAVALLDRDTHEIQTSDGEIYQLPVSMIENFLLDPRSIWQATQSVIEKTQFKSMHDITLALDSLLDNQEQDEISRRARVILGVACFRPSSSEDISDQALTFAKELQERYSPEKVAKAREQARMHVADLRRSHRRREEFDGKAILHTFYKTYLHQTGMSKEIFICETARHAKERKSVKAFFESFFENFL